MDARRRRQKFSLESACRDWSLEDRCLLSLPPSPYTFPGPFVNSIDKVLYNGVTGTYQKTITITNNSPTQWIYAFLEAQDSRQAVSPYEGTGAFDPYDPSNHEYRGYIGYTDGTNDYAGLPPQTSITITVPLVFWDSGRIMFSTDGADQFATYGGADGGSPPGAPFNYLDTNTQAMYFGTIDAGNLSQLNFTPIYNGFDASDGGKPTTQNWNSPVKSEILKDGQTYIVTGPGLPSGGSQVTIDFGHSNYVTLPTAATGAQTAQQYTFTALPGQSISPTDRYVQGGFTVAPLPLGSPGTADGLVMWYHALTSSAPNNDAPFQLSEISFRGTFYDPAINVGTGFQYLIGPDIDGAKTDSADYDISFVDTINLPVAMEASNVSIPNTNVKAPFGWVGSGQSIEDFQQAVAAFTSTNPAGGGNANSMGSYFNGQGYPSYLAVDPGNLKLPAGQSLFLASPAIGGAADIQYYKTFSDGSYIREPLYALTSGGDGPISLTIGGDVNVPSQGRDLGLNTVPLASQYALKNIIAPNVAAHHSYRVTYNSGGTTVFVGNVVKMYYAADGTTIIGVELDQDVPTDPGVKVYSFTLPQKDYAASAIAGLWYSWANYYVTHTASTPMTGVLGAITKGNILTLNDAAPGLVPGMTVKGTGVPAGCIVLSISTDRKTLELSTVVSGNPTSFDFSSPTMGAVVGYSDDPHGPTPPVDFSFGTGEQEFAQAFAETVYVVMSAWSASVPAGTANAWNPLLVNIIGGNLGNNYLEHANTDVMNKLTNMSKSALRGVPDFTNPLFSNPAQWYPDPALPAGGLTYNAYNLDPFVWLIHDKLGLTAYAFALDDDIGNVNAGGATHIDVSVGGLAGLTNKDPYTNTSPWGVVTTQVTAAQNNSSVLTGLTNPQIVYQTAQYDYAHDTPGTLVNGPGVPMGTTVQFLQIPQDLSKSSVILSNPLDSDSTGAAFAFFGPLTFTGTPASAAPYDTIILDSLDAYNTLQEIGPLTNIQVTGEGIDPQNIVTISSLTKSASGTITLQLNGSLNPNFISQPGGSYAYTFGSPKIDIVRDPGFEWANVEALGGGFNHGAQLTQNTVDWTFTDAPNPNDPEHPWYAGIAFNNTSKYTTGNQTAPQGLQVGFVQGDSQISQSVTLGKGTYSLGFSAAQSAINQSPHSLSVKVDDKVVGTINPAGTAYAQSKIEFTVEAGTYTITFEGNQADGGAVLLDAIGLETAKVEPRPQPPPVLNAIPDQRVDEGSTVSFTAHASGSTLPLTFSLGTDAPDGAQIDPSTGVFTWTPAAPGNYAVTVIVTDGGSPPQSVEQTVSITVDNVAPNVALSSGVGTIQTADFQDAGSFTDHTPGPFTGTVDYGDGTGLQPLALSPAGTFALDHTYTQPGTFTAIVSVTDSAGGVGTASVTLTAAAAPLTSGLGKGRDAFVTTLFQKELGRLPSPAGLKFWSKRLAAGVGPESVARGIRNSPEHRMKVKHGLIHPTGFRRAYIRALRFGRRAARLQLPPPLGPLTLTVISPLPATLSPARLTT
jgi:hypothetical protein